jgi:rhodanese-related sulfurtransferase
MDELAKRVTELETYRKRPIAIVCRTDKRSAAAAQLLTARGFGKIRVTRGGMTDWNRSGFPVAR